MKKLYYTDPISAAYMAKSFGVKLCQSIDEPEEEPLIFILEHAISTEYGAEYIHYVHPDSLSIFEPQAGDVVKWHNPQAFDRFNFKYSEVEKGKEKPAPDNEWWIIRRSGKSFIMPQEERANA